VLAKELAYYRAHFREAVQKDGVICLECGSIFKFLPGHLCKHKLSSDEYKAKWEYNRTTPLERLSTRRKKRRNAIAMKLWTLAPRDSQQKAIEAIRGHRWPYRPESRLIQTEAARARLAASFRLAKLQKKDKIMKKEKGDRHAYISKRSAVSHFKLCKEDRQILSLRKKGLWLGEIASRLGLGVNSVLWRLKRLRHQGFTIPRPRTLRPNANRKVTNEKLLAAVRSGLSIPEIAAKLGISVPTAHRRIKQLRRRPVNSRQTTERSPPRGRCGACMSYTQRATPTHAASYSPAINISPV
jgi:transposase